MHKIFILTINKTNSIFLYIKMSLLTNNNTIHLYNRWISPWYENSSMYSNLIYSDIYVYEFLNGIYYQLKIPSSIPIFKESNFNQIILYVNLHLFKKKKQKRSILLFNNKIEFLYFYKKILFFIHKSLFNKKQYFLKTILKKHDSIYKFKLLNNSLVLKNNYFFFNRLKFRYLFTKNTINYLLKKKYKDMKKNVFISIKKKHFLIKKIKYTNKKLKLRKLLTFKMKKKKFRKKFVSFKRNRKKKINCFIKKKTNNSRKKIYLVNNIYKNINVFLLLWMLRTVMLYYMLLVIKLTILNFFFIKNINLINSLKFTKNVLLVYKKNNILINNNATQLITCIKNKINKKYYWFNNYYYYLILNQLRLKITDTLNFYLSSNIIYIPYYKKKFVNIFDVKLLSDYIKIKLQYGKSIVKIMRKIVKIQSKQKFNLKKINKKYKKKLNRLKKKILNYFIMNIYNKNILYNNIMFCKKKIIKKKNRKLYFHKKKRIKKYLIKWQRKFRNFAYKIYPLIGIRIECNGPTKKGRRTKMVTYNEWVNYYKLPGKMPFSTKMVDLHYWQSYARTKRAAIGIKIWLFFRTNLYSYNKKIRKNIKYKI